MNKVNVLYDATVVCNILTRDTSRSGIFFVAYNILLEFLKHDEYNVYLYGNDEQKLHYLISNYPEFSKCKIYEFTCFNKLRNKLVLLKKEQNNFYRNPIVRMFLSLSASILKRLHNFTMLMKSKYPDIDVYFSPVYAVPKFLMKDKSIKKYTILHDTIPLIYNYTTGHEWYYKLVNSINSEDNYFVNSLCTKSDFIKYVPSINPDKITVIPLSTGKPYSKISDISFINQVKAKYNIPLNKKYIFSLCNIDPRKNLIFSVRNFLNFVEKNKLNDLIFVLGGGHFEDFIEKFNKDLKNFNSEKIYKIGYVDDEDMAALYSGAEMFLYTSLYEGFGMPVLEAMKCALPVICSNVSSIPEVIGDCGILVNPHSDDEMVAAMEKMYFDSKFRSECIKRGLERSEVFTWEKCFSIIKERIRENL